MNLVDNITELKDFIKNLQDAAKAANESGTDVDKAIKDFVKQNKAEAKQIKELVKQYDSLTEEQKKALNDLKKIAPNFENISVGFLDGITSFFKSSSDNVKTQFNEAKKDLNKIENPFKGYLAFGIQILSFAVEKGVTKYVDGFKKFAIELAEDATKLIINSAAAPDTGEIKKKLEDANKKIADENKKFVDTATADDVKIKLKDFTSLKGISDAFFKLISKFSFNIVNSIIEQVNAFKFGDTNEKVRSVLKSFLKIKDLYDNVTEKFDAIEELGDSIADRAKEDFVLPEKPKTIIGKISRFFSNVSEALFQLLTIAFSPLIDLDQVRTVVKSTKIDLSDKLLFGLTETVNLFANAIKIGTTNAVNPKFAVALIGKAVAEKIGDIAKDFIEFQVNKADAIIKPLEVTKLREAINERIEKGLQIDSKKVDEVLKQFIGIESRADEVKAALREAFSGDGVNADELEKAIDEIVEKAQDLDFKPEIQNVPLGNLEEALKLTKERQKEDEDSLAIKEKELEQVKAINAETREQKKDRKEKISNLKEEIELLQDSKKTYEDNVKLIKEQIKETEELIELQKKANSVNSQNNSGSSTLSSSDGPTYTDGSNPGEVSGTMDGSSIGNNSGNTGGIGGGSNGKIVTSNRLDRLGDEISKINTGDEAIDSLATALKDSTFVADTIKIDANKVEGLEQSDTGNGNEIDPEIVAAINRFTAKLSEVEAGNVDATPDFTDSGNLLFEQIKTVLETNLGEGIDKSGLQEAFVRFANTADLSSESLVKSFTEFQILLAELKGEVESKGGNTEVVDEAKKAIDGEKPDAENKPIAGNGFKDDFEEIGKIIREAFDNFTQKLSLVSLASAAIIGVFALLAAGLFKFGKNLAAKAFLNKEENDKLKELNKGRGEAKNLLQKANQGLIKFGEILKTTARQTLGSKALAADIASQRKGESEKESKSEAQESTATVKVNPVLNEQAQTNLQNQLNDKVELTRNINVNIDETSANTFLTKFEQLFQKITAALNSASTKVIGDAQKKIEELRAAAEKSIKKSAEDGLSFDENGLPIPNGGGNVPITSPGPGELSGVLNNGGASGGNTGGIGNIGGGSNGKIVTSNRLEGLRAEYNRFLESYDGFSGLAASRGEFSRIAVGEDGDGDGAGGLGGLNPENIDLSVFEELKECLNVIITTLEQASNSSSAFGTALNSQGTGLTTIKTSLQSVELGIANLTQLFSGLGSTLAANNAAFIESTANIDSTSAAYDQASISAETMATSTANAGTSLQKSSTDGVKGQQNLAKQVVDTNKTVGDQSKEIDEHGKKIKENSEGIEENVEKQKSFSDAMSSGLNVMSQVGSATTFLTSSLKQITGATDDSELGQFIGTVGEIGETVSSVAGTLQDNLLPMLEQSGGLFGDNSKEMAKAAKSAAIADKANKQLNTTKQLQSGLTKANITSTAIEDGVQKKAAVSKGIAARAQQGLNAAMKANPIGFIIGLIIPLVSAIGSFVAKTEFGKKAIAGAFGAIKAAVNNAGQVIKTALKVYFFPIITAFKAIKGAVGGLISGFKEGGLIGAVKGAFGGAKDAVVENVKDTVDAVKDTGKKLADGFTEGLESVPKLTEEELAKQKDVIDSAKDLLDSSNKRIRQLNADRIENEEEKAAELLKIAEDELRAKYELQIAQLENLTFANEAEAEANQQLIDNLVANMNEEISILRRDSANKERERQREAAKKTMSDREKDEKDFYNRLGKIADVNIEKRKELALKEVKLEEENLKKQLGIMLEREQITKEQFNQLAADIEAGTAEMRKKVQDAITDEVFDKVIGEIQQGFERLKNEILAEAGSLNFDGSVTLEAELKINSKAIDAKKEEIDELQKKLNETVGEEARAAVQDEINKAKAEEVQLQLKKLALDRQIREELNKQNKLKLQLDTSLVNADGTLNFEGQRRALLLDQADISANISDLEQLKLEKGANIASIEAKIAEAKLKQLDLDRQALKLQEERANAKIEESNQNIDDGIQQKRLEADPGDLDENGNLKAADELQVVLDEANRIQKELDEIEINLKASDLSDEDKAALKASKAAIISTQEELQNRVIELNVESLEEQKAINQAVIDNDESTLKQKVLALIEQENLVNQQIALLEEKQATIEGLTQEEIDQLIKLRQERKKLEETTIKDLFKSVDEQKAANKEKLKDENTSLEDKAEIVEEQKKLVDQQLEALAAKLEKEGKLSDEEIELQKKLQDEKTGLVKKGQEIRNQIIVADAVGAAKDALKAFEDLDLELGFEFPFDSVGKAIDAFKGLGDAIKDFKAGDGDPEDIVNNLAAISQAVFDMANAIVDAKLEELTNQLELVNEELEGRKGDLESELEKQRERQEQGLANNYDELKDQYDQINELTEDQNSEQKRLSGLSNAELIAEQKKAQKEKEALQKKKEKIETANQAVSLITAAANIMLGYSSIPIVGPIIGATIVAAMIAGFVATKVQAKRAAEGKYMGGYTGDGNPRHESGHFTHKQEYVIPHKPTQKYRRNLLEGIHYGERAKVLEGVASVMQDYNIAADDLIPARSAGIVKPNTAKIVEDLRASNQTFKAANANLNARARVEYEKAFLNELKAINSNTETTASNTSGTTAIVQQGNSIVEVVSKNGNIYQTVIDTQLDFDN